MTDSTQLTAAKWQYTVTVDGATVAGGCNYDSEAEAWAKAEAMATEWWGDGKIRVEVTPDMREAAKGAEVRTITAAQWAEVAEDVAAGRVVVTIMGFHPVMAQREWLPVVSVKLIDAPAGRYEVVTDVNTFVVYYDKILTVTPAATSQAVTAQDAVGAVTKTREEIDHLKDNWIGDPCWDIEDTKGFEAHYNELRDWRFNREETEAIKEENRLMTKAVALGCSVELVGYIETLERRLSRLEAE